MAHLKETYKHWKADTEKRLTDWDREEQGLEGYEENEGYISNFFIPVTDGNQPYMSSPPISNMMGYTASALQESVNQSTGKNCLCLNTSPSMRKVNTPTGSSTHSAIIQPIWPWLTTHEPRKIGGS